MSGPTTSDPGSDLGIPAAPEIPGATHIHSGKVRDLYRLEDGRLLMVASDRISAYHFVSSDVPDSVRGRAVVCEELDMFPVECVARGYLTGSGLADYRATGEVCGIALPPGLEDGSRLPEPIFTPATKAALGDHDENVSYDAVVAVVGPQRAAELRRLTLAVYGRAEAIARERGIILADTKLEFRSRGD